MFWQHNTGIWFTRCRIKDVLIANFFHPKIAIMLRYVAHTWAYIWLYKMSRDQHRLTSFTVLTLIWKFLYQWRPKLEKVFITLERPSVFTELFPNASFPSVQSLLSIQHGRRNIRKSSFSLAENRSEETSFLFKANRIKTKRCFKAKLYHDVGARDYDDHSLLVGVRPSCQ